MHGLAAARDPLLEDDCIHDRKPCRSNFAPNTAIPPGASKWNKIEHRLFCHITTNWRGKPLVSHQVIVQLIGSTSTDTGPKVCCEIDSNLYPKGIEVTDEEMQAINISRNEFHGEWNYTISPNQKPP